MYANTLQNRAHLLSYSRKASLRLGIKTIMPFNLTDILTTVFGAGGVLGSTYVYLNGRKQLEKDKQQSDVESAIKLGQNAFDISRELQAALHKDIAEMREQNRSTADTLAVLIDENKKLARENVKLMEANRVLLEENNILLHENKKLHEEVKILVSKVAGMNNARP